MANTYRGEIQDNKGNTVYPHTESEIVFCPDGDTAQEKFVKYENALGNVTGTTDSLEVSDSNILATSKAVNELNNSLTANNSDGSFVDLSTYKSESSRYTFPSDGYLVLSFEGLKLTYMRVPVFSANGNIIAQLCSTGSTDDYNTTSSDTKSLFVKKGMSAYVSVNNGGNNTIRFYPIS